MTPAPAITHRVEYTDATGKLVVREFTNGAEAFDLTERLERIGVFWAMPPVERELTADERAAWVADMALSHRPGATERFLNDLAGVA